jgi:hypothetical protein
MFQSEEEEGVFSGLVHSLQWEEAGEFERVIPLEACARRKYSLCRKKLNELLLWRQLVLLLAVMPEAHQVEVDQLQAIIMAQWWFVFVLLFALQPLPILHYYL